MSSGQERVDVSVETKKAPDTPAEKSHPNTCPRCGSHYRDDELAQNLRVCPQCGHHFPVGARERIEQLADPGSFAEEDAELRSADPLGFFDLRPYAERLAEAEIATGLGDAIVCGSATIEDEGCRLVGHGLLVHGRLDGKRGRGEVRARLREREPRAACRSCPSPRRAALACRRGSSR